MEAFKDARGSVNLKLKKSELKMFAIINSAFISGIEFNSKSTDQLDSAILSTTATVGLVISSTNKLK